MHFNCFHSGIKFFLECAFFNMCICDICTHEKQRLLCLIVLERKKYQENTHIQNSKMNNRWTHLQKKPTATDAMFSSEILLQISPEYFRCSFFSKIQHVKKILWLLLIVKGANSLNQITKAKDLLEIFSISSANYTALYRLMGNLLILGIKRA